MSDRKNETDIQQIFNAIINSYSPEERQGIRQRLDDIEQNHSVDMPALCDALTDCLIQTKGQFAQIPSSAFINSMCTSPLRSMANKLGMETKYKPPDEMKKWLISQKTDVGLVDPPVFDWETDITTKNNLQMILVADLRKWGVSMRILDSHELTKDALITKLIDTKAKLIKARTESEEKEEAKDGDLNMNDLYTLKDLQGLTNEALRIILKQGMSYPHGISKKNKAQLISIIISQQNDDMKA